jgi:hypothetical protein
MAIKRAVAAQIAAFCFVLAGMLWCLAALIGGNTGVNVPIGMMNLTVGMLFLAMSRTHKQREDTQQASSPPEDGKP